MQSRTVNATPHVGRGPLVADWRAQRRRWSTSIVAVAEQIGAHGPRRGRDRARARHSGRQMAGLGGPALPATGRARARSREIDAIEPQVLRDLQRVCTIVHEQAKMRTRSRASSIRSGLAGILPQRDDARRRDGRTRQPRQDQGGLTMSAQRPRGARWPAIAVARLCCGQAGPPSRSHRRRHDEARLSFACIVRNVTPSTR